MVLELLELLDLFHLASKRRLFDPETSLAGARRLSGLIKMRSADLERIFQGSVGDIAR